MFYRISLVPYELSLLLLLASVPVLFLVSLLSPLHGVDFVNRLTESVKAKTRAQDVRRERLAALYREGGK